MLTYVVDNVVYEDNVYVKLTNGMLILIPEKWLDIYERLAGKKVLKGVGWSNDKISSVGEVWNGGDKGEILGVVIYV